MYTWQEDVFMEPLRFSVYNAYGTSYGSWVDYDFRNITMQYNFFQRRKYASFFGKESKCIYSLKN